MAYRGASTLRPWELAGVVAYYQPVGAPSAVDALQNMGRGKLGTYTAAPGIAPTWTPQGGWEFVASSTQYLSTSIIAPTDPGLSIICRFSAIANDGCIVGTRAVSAYIFLLPALSAAHYYRHRGGNLAPVGTLTAGIMAFAGTTAYLNGADDGTMTVTDFTAMPEFDIGRRNGTFDRYLSGSIQAILFVYRILTPAEVWLASKQMAYCEQNPDWNAWAVQQYYWIIPPATPADGTLSVNVSDSITVSESVSCATAALTVNVSESITVVETVSVLLVHLVSTSESVTVSESVAVQLVHLVTTSESVTVSESVAAQLVHLVAVSESVSVSESVGVTIVDANALAIGVTENITVSESVILAIALAISTTQNITVAENVVAQLVYLVAVSESLTVSESVNVLHVLLISTSESVTVSESSTEQLVHLVAAAELLTVSEQATLSIPVAVAVTQNVIVTESAGAAMVLSDLGVGISESITVTEATWQTFVLLVGVLENITVGQAITLAGLLHLLDGVVADTALWDVKLRDVARWNLTLADAALSGVMLADVSRSTT